MVRIYQFRHTPIENPSRNLTPPYTAPRMPLITVRFDVPSDNEGHHKSGARRRS